MYIFGEVKIGRNGLESIINKIIVEVEYILFNNGYVIYFFFKVFSYYFMCMIFVYMCGCMYVYVTYVCVWVYEG